MVTGAAGIGILDGTAAMPVDVGSVVQYVTEADWTGWAWLGGKVIGAIIVGLVLYALVFFLARRAASRSDHPLDDRIVAHLRRPAV